MKNILFLVNKGKISPNENGGASVYYSHLQILYQLGYKINLLVMDWSGENIIKEFETSEVAHLVTSIINFTPTYSVPSNKIRRFFEAIDRPDVFEYHFLNDENKEFLEKEILKNKIDIVWAEWRWTALLASYSKLTVPVIYAHHDWEYKLSKLRKKINLLGKFHNFQKKRVEIKLVQSVSACVSGSFTEMEEIKKISNKEALYIPTTYENIELIEKGNTMPILVHLGGMGTTANRLGLERFLDVCWNDLKKENKDIQLHVIGSITSANGALREKLNDAQIICKGFIENLDSVLKPGDIHIIPWEYNTGTRTRLPLVFNYQQVLIATKASVEAFPEVINGENSVLCDDLEQMTDEILKLLADTSKLKKISDNAKDTFIESFSHASQLKKANNFLDKII
jgi:glycosyltransferase involved in cell wall biosynthesis